MLSDTFSAILSIWNRNRQVYLRQWRHSLLTTFAEPLAYLLSFGVGMSTVVSQVSAGGQTVSYRSFVFAGIVAQSLLYGGFFVAAYGGFSRMHYQKIFLAMVTTPITFAEVIWGELLWNTSRATFSSSAILLIGCGAGDFSPSGALAALPLCFVAALLFSAIGMWAAALANDFNDLYHAQFYLVFPMFLMCGIFFPIENLPKWMHFATWLFPLTPVLSLLRSLLLGLDQRIQSLPLIVAWTILSVTLAQRTTLKRLTK